jgi:hypothetical protein
MNAQDTMVTYRSFDEETFAEELATQLREAGITVQVSYQRHPIDPLIIGSGTDNDYLVQIRSSDFTKANELLEKQYGSGLPELPSDYYLYDFTEKELFEVIEKPDEWNPLDVQLARQLLVKKGVSLDEEAIYESRQKRLTRMARSEDISIGWRIVGWLLALVLSVVGLLYGLVVMNLRKTLPDGGRYYVYTPGSRRFGRNIAIVAGIMIVAGLFFRFGLIAFLLDLIKNKD